MFYFEISVPTLSSQPRMIAHQQRVSGRKRGPPEAFNPLLDGRSDTERNRPLPLALAGPPVLPSGHLVAADGEAAGLGFRV